MELTKEQIYNFATKQDVKDLQNELSKQITIEIRDTFWKIIPITITIQLTMSSLIAACMFFVARTLM